MIKDKHCTVSKKRNAYPIAYCDKRLKPLANLLKQPPQTVTQGMVMDCVERICKGVSREDRYKLVTEAEQMINTHLKNLLLTKL